MSKPSINQSAGRHFLTDRIRLEVDWRGTAQSRGIAPPPVQKPAPEGATLARVPGTREFRGQHT